MHEGCLLFEILSILGPPGYPKPIALATLSKASPAASSLVFPKFCIFHNLQQQLNEYVHLILQNPQWGS